MSNNIFMRDSIFKLLIISNLLFCLIFYDIFLFSPNKLS